MHKLPFGPTTLSSSHVLDIVFSDVWTSPLVSVDGFKYYVIFVDHFTRYTWFYPLKKSLKFLKLLPSLKLWLKIDFNPNLKLSILIMVENILL